MRFPRTMYDLPEYIYMKNDCIIIDSRVKDWEEVFSIIEEHCLDNHIFWEEVFTAIADGGGQ